jgi:outer membrane protein assembly factor BamE (lipoprotein component of BamABCDE complex)
MKKLLSLLVSSLLSLFLFGCVTASDHYNSLPDQSINNKNKITVGIVQKEISQGMTETQVAQALGAPNIVSSDSPGEETWIYDKISTTNVYSKSSGGISTLFLGWTGNVAGGGGAGYSASSGASSTSQQTLTIIIKFKGGKVSEFFYHSSSF